MKIRRVRALKISGRTRSPNHDPSSNGMPIMYNVAPAYIGWRTIAYGPVLMTRCPRSSWIFITGAANEFSRKVSHTIRAPFAFTTSLQRIGFALVKLPDGAAAVESVLFDYKVGAEKQLR